MKYTKSILSFVLLNLVLVFSMIFIANKTREIEKNNINLKNKISIITEDIKINKIEFIAHQNSSYLKKLYSIYFSENKENKTPSLILIKMIIKDDKNIRLVKAKN